MSSDSKWLKGALLLTVAGLISKVLSAGYRIPLQNLTGDIGFYIYQQVYPLLGMGMILALYGFPSAISKLTAESKKKGNTRTTANFYYPIFLILFLVMGTLAVLLFVSASSLASWIGDPGLTQAYQLVAFSFLLIPFTSLLRGVMQGSGNMKPTAYSQIGEQFFRVLLILAVAVYVSFSGADLYRIGEGAAIAGIGGALTAIFILTLFVRKSEQPPLLMQTSVPWRYYIQTILLFGLVASLNHMVLLLFQFADAFTLVSGLQEYGLSQVDAMEAKGVLDRGQPLIQLGTVLGSSFALAMIPSVSQHRLQEDAPSFYQHIRSSIAIGFYLAVGATAGLIAIMPEANILLFEDTKGTSDLQILVFAILLSSIGVTCATILQGLGWTKRTAIFIILSVFVKGLGNELLVPIFGITGAAIATILGLACFSLLVFIELKRKLPKLMLIRQINWQAVLLAVSAMLLYIFIIDLFIPELSRVDALLYVGFVAGTGACIYLFILLRGRAFISEEINMLPFSHIWMRIYKERKRT
ncbi:putative polysaccharide biosynthesis protein [Oceanobacillus alkalisoli]|uniref:putative polysaccharide biosynthesis protein n=1 Tax=Oceanobacillus alkalisoli TaxID=2925113 RepID=UPI001EF1065B|nr:polysaccharide biosynthesis protein [Oceanobacillus alkalisoli]MCF3944465.1 polysaccharide biosynthesis protein [Oceanobacillus alkalisoli]MCG5105121.1 polysaccharide biosynthesis protein [Oceanobacillus alkalisoli]